MEPYLFQDQDLPQGFIFPGAFVRILSDSKIPYYEPWWFLNKFPDEAAGWLDMLRRYFPSRVLVPFAKYGIYDRVVCFDGTDVSGDPRVFYVNAGATPGWEDWGGEVNFAAWLERAKRDAAEWIAARSGDQAPPG
jgi:hypothetical protein